MAEAPPPYTAKDGGYVKPPSASFLATHPSAGKLVYSQRPGDTQFRPTPLGQPSPDIPNNPPQKQLYTEAPGDTQLRLANPQRSPNMCSKSSFPEFFGIYHASGTTSDMMITLSADSQPIFHVSTHGGFSSQPSVVLHSGPHQNASPMATADFHSFSSDIDIVLFNTPLKLESEGAFNPVRVFKYPMPQANGQTVLEMFQWKHSSGPEVQGLKGSSHGYKCVRAKTGEVVAAWARPNSGHRKKGKMRFLMRDRIADDRFETCLVITMLAIMEKLRRKKNSSNAAAAGGGGC